MVSIIVPIYNVKDYLRPCIESLIDQDYKDVEILLIDDGSTDGSSAICDEYAQKDLRVRVFHKTNGGQASARNLGLGEARGEFISFIDGDDYVSKTMYSTLVPLMEKYECDIATCGFITHSGVREALSVTPSAIKVWDDTEQIMCNYLQTKYIDGNSWNKIYRKSLWHDLRFPVGVAREDVYIMYRVLGTCRRLVHSATCEYHYILRPCSSERQSFNPKFLISLKIADDRKEYINEHFPSLLYLAERSCYGARISAIKKIVRSHAEKSNNDVLKELKDYLSNHKPLTKQQAQDRTLILHFPMLYRIKMDWKYIWRQKFKKVILSVMNKKI